MKRRVGWLVGVALTVTLVVLALLVTVGRANRQQADDPRATVPSGAGALGALLADGGVRVTTTGRVDDALAAAGPERALVVARANVLDTETARRLLTAGYGRVLLLRPTQQALERFGVRARGRAAPTGPLVAGCPVDAAERAGSVTMADASLSYLATGPADFSCYRAGNGGYAYLRVGTTAGVPVELLAGGVSNAALAQDGNAALGLGVLGAQPELTWLMARSDPPAASTAPSLLPPWWPLAVAQAAIAFGIAAVWRGRRLGPIIAEPLPVTVRAAETVEGHGRLYHRLNAYDRATSALRSGTLDRLGRVFGHAEDPLTLSAAVADRTGLDPGRVRRMLVDARPTTDADLVTLASDLNRLEQEARRL